MPREVTARERKADGVDLATTSTQTSEYVESVRVRPHHGQVVLSIGSRLKGSDWGFGGGAITLSRAEAAHVAGLLLAASAEVSA